jgi:ABC-2 type transport system permease protein
MISYWPISAIVLRHVRLWTKDPNILLAFLYWPILDILIWGFLGNWIQKSQGITFQNYTMVALLGVLLWQIVGRGCNALCNTLNEELWSGNVINLFSLPLKMSEWIVAAIVVTAIVITITAVFCVSLTALLYDVSMLQLLKTFLLFAPPLFISCIWLGFTSLSIVTILGKRGVELGYILSWFFMPFCGAYYPIEILPVWGQAISVWLPMSYVFQGMRQQLMHNQDPLPYLFRGYLLSSMYAIFAVVVFVYCFNRSRKNGLVRLMD